MAVNNKLVYLVLGGYFAMFVIMGILSAAAAIGGPHPGPDDFQVLNQAAISPGAEPLFKSFFLEPFQNAQQRFTKLGEICLSSFQIIIGAIIGFLSAIGSIALGNRPTGEPTNSGRNVVAPTADGGAPGSAGTVPPSV